ncbi:hypothetical protein R1sor_009374 [Riccia sorocarpa]|uniref:Uncharacterized protein n=1 Tax=Riccia sorocarpa TaxID=122646 RepID=A0ABD3HUY2_9MARC
MEATFMTDLFRTVRRKKYHRFDSLDSSAEGLIAPKRILKRLNADVGRSRTRILIRNHLFRFIRHVCLLSCSTMSHCASSRSRASASMAAGIHRNARDHVFWSQHQQRKEADNQIQLVWAYNVAINGAALSDLELKSRGAQDCRGTNGKYECDLQIDD